MYFGSIRDWYNVCVGMSGAMQAALERACALDLNSLPPGRYEIDGERVFLLIQATTTQAVGCQQPEAHRRYADIQLLLDGRERFGVSAPDINIIPLVDRLATDDIAFYPPSRNEFFVDILPGQFILILPGEFHRPCCSIDRDEPIRKAVIKVRVDNPSMHSDPNISLVGYPIV